MQTKVLIGVVVAIAILGGAYIFFAGEAQAPTNGPETSQPEETGETNNMTPDSNVVEDNQGTTTQQNNEDGSDTNEQAGEPAATVTYTDEGFSPETVTVQQGQAVTFVNESNGDMWVASAVHPTHTVYPEKTGDDCLGSAFDACQSISTGDSWSFTFNETGEWGYHNHRRANHTGVVVVEE